jgi:hypothetical protein
LIHLHLFCPQDTSSKCPKPSYSTVCYTQKGLAYYSDWGTLRNTGNMMFMAALMGKYGNNKASALCFARNQMRYILGSDTGKSYLIGFGTNQPQRPHHRQSACNAKYNEPCSASDSGTCCAGESGKRQDRLGGGGRGLDPRNIYGHVKCGVHHACRLAHTQEMQPMQQCMATITTVCVNYSTAIPEQYSMTVAVYACAAF